MSSAIRFNVRSGFPFARRVRMTDGKNIWPNVEDIEARMQIRAKEDIESELKYDFTPHLITSLDNNDIIIEWSLTGAQTRTMKEGYFDLVVSDIGATDARAIPLLHGYVNLSTSNVTTAGEVL